MSAIVISLMVGACVAGAAFANLDNYTSTIDFVERDLAERLRALRVRAVGLRRWINAWLGIVLLFFLVLGVMFQAFALATPLAILMCAGPWYMVRRVAQQRRQKIEDQLADVMVMFSSAIKAGMSIPQSIELLAIDSPQPICQEFQQIAGEYKLGKPLERTLNEAKSRMGSENFALFTAALLASRESGGRLNDTVDRISRSVLELQRLERKVMSETAQARKSAVYMAVVPVFLLVVYAAVDPENTERLFTTLPGQIILSASMLLNLVAYLWSLKILKADI